MISFRLGGGGVYEAIIQTCTGRGKFTATVVHESDRCG